MIDFYVMSIRMGLKTIAQVPAFLKAQVKETLEALGMEELTK